MVLDFKEPSVGWLFFSWKGRIARQSYFLAAALIIVVNFYIIIETTLAGEGGAGEGTMAFWGFALIIGWIVSVVISLALAIKRLHDINFPSWCAFAIFIPGLGSFFMLALMFIPSVQETNEHGPPPFPIR